MRVSDSSEGFSSGSEDEMCVVQSGMRSQTSVFFTTQGMGTALGRERCLRSPELLLIPFCSQCVSVLSEYAGVCVRAWGVRVVTQLHTQMGKEGPIGVWHLP